MKQQTKYNIIGISLIVLGFLLMWIGFYFGNFIPDWAAVPFIIIYVVAIILSIFFGFAFICEKKLDDNGKWIDKKLKEIK